MFTSYFSSSNSPKNPSEEASREYQVKILEKYGKIVNSLAALDCQRGDMKRQLSSVVLAFILASLFIASLRIERARAAGVIYIRSDGSVEPSDAPIQRNGSTYNLTGDISCSSDGIVIERDGAILNGAGYALQGAGIGTGINVSQQNNIAIMNLKIRSFHYGIWLSASSNNALIGNSITDNFDGIDLWNSSNNNTIFQNNITTNTGLGIGLSSSSNNNVSNNYLVAGLEDDIYLNNSSNNIISGNTVLLSAWTGIGIFGSSKRNLIIGNEIANNTMFNIRLYWSSENSIIRNNITDNVVGIQFDNSSTKNTVCGNNLTNNGYGIRFSSSCSENVVLHNNLENNTVHQIYTGYSANILDDGYPSGGNYWSDYNGTDVFAGSFQDETGNDGIGDSAHVLDAKNADRYPLMGRFETYYVGSWNEAPCFVDITSNSTVADFGFNASQKCISFNVTGSSSEGFCRVTIDNALLGGPYTVQVNTTQLDFTTESNGTHSFIYFTYSQSTQKVWITGTSAIPEFPSAMIFQLLIVITLLAVAFCRRIIPKSKFSWG
jgi:parallel beta-helix repeat protein